jgi:hypothetical protein
MFFECALGFPVSVTLQSGHQSMPFGARICPLACAHRHQRAWTLPCMTSLALLWVDLLQVNRILFVRNLPFKITAEEVRMPFSHSQGACS